MEIAFTVHFTPGQQLWNLFYCVCKCSCLYCEITCKLITLAVFIVEFYIVTINCGSSFFSICICNGKSLGICIVCVCSIVFYIVACEVEFIGSIVKQCKGCGFVITWNCDQLITSFCCVSFFGIVFCLIVFRMKVIISYNFTFTGICDKILLLPPGSPYHQPLHPLCTPIRKHCWSHQASCHFLQQDTQMEGNTGKILQSL